LRPIDHPPFQTAEAVGYFGSAAWTWIHLCGTWPKRELCFLPDPNKNTQPGLRLRPSQRFHDLAAIAAALLRSMNFMLQPCCAVSD
jgi:hypothetical protein